MSIEWVRKYYGVPANPRPQNNTLHVAPKAMPARRSLYTARTNP